MAVFCYVTRTPIEARSMNIPVFAGGLFTVDRVPLIPSASYEALRTDAEWSVFQYVFKASSDNWPMDHVRLIWFVPQFVVPEAVDPVALGHIVKVGDDDDTGF